MKIGIMQPYFFPYIGYWQLISMVDEYVILDDVNYIKRGWINRNYILFERMPRRINLNIRDASQNRLIKDTEIAWGEKDVERFLSIIHQSYRRAPYFKKIYNVVEDIVKCNYGGLSDFLTYQIRMICDYLQINTEIVLSSRIDKDNSLKGENKIIDICKKQKADSYINSIGGKELYHKDKFQKENIELKFLKSISQKYKQFENDFVGNLSIIDVLMFNSVEEMKELMMQFEMED